MATGIKGIDTVTRNLQKKYLEYNAGSTKGMIRAIALIRVDMDKTPPLIPVDTGNLRSSWFTSLTYDPKTRAPSLVFGFSSNYAAAVHELYGTKSGDEVNWKREGSGPGFFAASLKRNQKQVIAILKSEMK